MLSHCRLDLNSLNEMMKYLKCYTDSEYVKSGKAHMNGNIKC